MSTSQKSPQMGRAFAMAQSTQTNVLAAENVDIGANYHQLAGIVSP
tara:strand:+ start:273 stop:410 length:138 start_codon:yes stop_codon:yes gene_type:complete